MDLPTCSIPDPSEALQLEWYYMSYHRSNRKKLVLSKTNLESKTLESITKFFQNLYEIRKNNGMLEHLEYNRV